MTDTMTRPPSEPVLPPSGRPSAGEWMRKNLFSTWYNTLFTVIFGLIWVAWINGSLYHELHGRQDGRTRSFVFLQMALLEPKLAILDETDSGLDIDALQVVAKGVNAMRSPDRSFVLVTHYQRLLNFIEPDFVHVLSGGRIVRSGDKSLALELEEKGYGWIEAEVA